MKRSIWCAVVLVAAAQAVRGAGPGADPVVRALERAKENRVQLEKALQEAQTAAGGAQAAGMRFLIANMPERDLKELSADFLLENSRLAYEAREKYPWAKAIPEDLFFNYVLPYANVNEKRDGWRAEFVKLFGPEVKECKTAGEAAVLLNKRAFEILKVQYHPTKRPKPDQSPLESKEAGYASCTGLSNILIDACRAVGVPARMAGTPSWTVPKGDANGNHGGNHMWVEIWDGQWHHLGAAEPSALDQTWFNENASRADAENAANSIYAASFRKTGTWFPLVWDLKIKYVTGFNVSGFYAARREVPVVAAGRDKGRVAARLVVKSEGETLADLTLPKEGEPVKVILPAGKTFDAEVTPLAADATVGATKVKLAAPADAKETVTLQVK